MIIDHKELGACSCPICAGPSGYEAVDESGDTRSPQMAPVYSNSQVIGQIDSGANWSGSTITYGFLQTSPSWDIGYEGDGFVAFTDYQIAATQLIMTLWDDLISPSFAEQSSSQEYANVKFGNSDTSINYAHAYYPGIYAWAGEVWLNAPSYNALYYPDPGDYYFMTILHEVGHAIGLSHPGSYNGGSPTYANDAVYAQDTHQWTVMSYFDASNTGADWNGGSGWQYAQTPMVHDILTIQSIYGADTTTRTGHTTYGFNSNADNSVFDFSSNTSPVLSIYDAGGIDTLDLSGFSLRAIVDLMPGSYSSVGGTTSTMTYNIGIAVDTWIENAIGGSGNDTLYGNSANNVLDGRGGTDLVAGGLGDDSYYVDNAGDVVTENSSEGTDSVYSTVAWALGSNLENLHLLGSANINATGNGLANFLYGNSGSNTLDGMGGADTMVGGAGDDIYHVDQAGDVTIESAGEGFDTVFAGFSTAMRSNIEAFVATGSASFSVAGNDQDNFLYGNSGNNNIVGGGGLDNMYGGLGDDIYYFDDLGDAAFENIGEGFDTVFASIGMGLPTSSSIEALVLTGTANLAAFGNNLPNFVYGNTGNNYLDGGGSYDAMYGRQGDDLYAVHDFGDQAIENANEGFDTVYSDITFALAANVEALVLTGTGSNNATGNASNNFLYGNSGNNVIDGQAGIDVMTGNGGLDTFVFRPGETNACTITDFDGNGILLGDTLQFLGFGLGASFAQTDATHWAVTYNGGASIETITFSNAASIDLLDYLFIV